MCFMFILEGLNHSIVLNGDKQKQKKNKMNIIYQRAGLESTEHIVLNKEII